MRKVAALYVETDGCYFNLEHVDPWDTDRDARLYNGPYPVVAHPPCQRWGNLAYVNYKRYGGEHNRPGNDGGCFEAALASVRKYGGVLEHPAFTHAWLAYNLQRPNKDGWSGNDKDGWVCEVWQSAYGHRARKRTWLYFFSPTGRHPFNLTWARPKGTHQVGWWDKRGKEGNKPTLSKKEANATPLSFRDVLLKLAYHSATMRKEDCYEN